MMEWSAKVGVGMLGQMLLVGTIAVVVSVGGGNHGGRDGGSYRGLSPLQLFDVAQHDFILGFDCQRSQVMGLGLLVVALLNCKEIVISVITRISKW